MLSSRDNNRKTGTRNAHRSEDEESKEVKLTARFQCKPWPDKETTKCAFESLVYWYTVEEIAKMMGRSYKAVVERMHRVGVKARWKKSYKGTVYRIWQDREKMLLYDLCETHTQILAAKKLGVSKDSASAHWSKTGAAWRQGWISLTDLSKIAGCTVAAMSVRARKLFKVLPASGNGSGRRYNFTLLQAEKLMQNVRPGRVSYIRKMFGDG